MSFERVDAPSVIRYTYEIKGFGIMLVFGKEDNPINFERIYVSFYSKTKQIGLTLLR